MCLPNKKEARHSFKGRYSMHKPVKEIPFIDTSCGSLGGHNDMLSPVGESPVAEYIDKNLQLYLTAPPDGFTALCRKFTASYFPRGMVLDFTMHIAKKISFWQCAKNTVYACGKTF